MANTFHAAAINANTTTRVAANDSPEDVSPTERLSWLVELMSRYAREFADSHDSHESPRLAAAIVAHLRSLASDLPPSGRMADTAEHWVDVWDTILSLHLRKGEPMASSPSLRSLVDRARAF
jgi:hypothetical protein